MHAAPACSPRRQQGVAAVMFVILLIAGVLIILNQTLNIVGTRSVDNAQDADSAAALMLAESGLQRAQAIIGTAATGGLYTDTSCTDVGAGGPFALGRGSFSYGTAVSDPAVCGALAPTPCSHCMIAVTGTVGSAARTLNLLIDLGIVNGTTGKSQTVSMVLKNTHEFPAVAIFQLAWQRQSSGGNADASICSNGATGCGNRWNVESSSGNTSVGSMGVSVDIPALTYSKVVVQQLSQSRYYAEVGALFPGLTGAPTVMSSYWKESGGAHSKTVANSGNTGQTNSGVAAATGTCAAPPDVYGSGSDQTCNNWCYGADTLVFGVSGRSGTVTDEITSITFNTGGTAPQNVPMTRIVHFPDTDGSIVNASGKIYAEVWKAYNPEYMSTGTGAGVTSYPTAVLATAGANPVLSANLSNHDTTMTVASLSDSNARICHGDRLSGDGNINGAVITAPSGCGTTGVYTFSPEATGNVNKNNVIVSSTTLRVQGQTGGNFASGATNTAGVSIASGPSGGNYTLSNAANIGNTAYITQGSSGTTISVPSGSGLPSVGTRLAVYSLASAGQGAFAANTTVQSVGADSFTVSAVPSTALYGATVCGGTCAFFDNPSSTASTTDFTVNASGGTTQWGGGFICLKGVNDPIVTPVTSTTSSGKTWREAVQ